MVAQYLLTVVIVLGLIGAVWWFMRRYSGVHFGGSAADGYPGWPSSMPWRSIAAAG